jgi:hypothetical protein
MCFRIRAYLLVLFASAFAALGAGPAAADNVFTQNGVGVSGYDPVAYFADGKALPGSAQFTAEYHGIAYKFASAAHRTPSPPTRRNICRNTGGIAPMPQPRARWPRPIPKRSRFSTASSISISVRTSVSVGCRARRSSSMRPT